MTVQVQNGCGVSVVYPHDPVHDWEKVSYHILLARGKIKIQNLKFFFFFFFFNKSSGNYQRKKEFELKKENYHTDFYDNRNI